MTGDVEALKDTNLPLQDQRRQALLNGFRAASSSDAAAKEAAVHALLALPEDQQEADVASLVAQLGDREGAFKIGARLAATDFPGPAVFWYPRMRPVLDLSAFSALAQRLGLVHYWRASHTKPDVCNGAGPPAFCRML